MKWLIIIAFVSINTYANEKELSELWTLTQSNSERLKSEEAQLELMSLKKDRAGRHWIPRVMLGARSYKTNDPGSVLFNNLGQGAVEQEDFAEANINNPDDETYTNTSLMIDLPLYEGGLKDNQNKMYKKLLESQQLNKEATYTQSFSELFVDYGMISRNHLNSNLLNKINRATKNILAKYKVGTKQNPVGYSGLLGLKSVINRVDAFLVQLAADSDFRLNLIRFKTAQENLSVKKEKSISQFVAKFKESHSKRLSSTKLENFKLKIDAIGYTSDMEQARYLPQVGLFASSNQYIGDRDENNVQTMGVYLKWDLFNNDSYGRVAEAKKKIISMKQKYSYAAKKESSYKKSLESALIALKKNDKTLKQTLNLLDEQTKISFKLFKRGKLSGIQMAQILNQKIDLIEQNILLEEKLITTTAQNYQLYN